MPFGILEASTKLQHVPGTALLEETELGRTTNLKKSAKHDDIVLIPQPSNDPNDPLNWPLWQRDMILLLYCYCTLLCIGGVGPVLSVFTLDLIMEFHINFTQVALLLGYQLLAVGATGLILSATSRKYGKRPNFILSMALAWAGTLWGGASKSYGSLMGARVVQGLGIAMFESVTFAIIGDLYFVHQRGSRMALYILAQSGIAHLPSIVAGPITQSIGWRWVFWLLSIFMGIGFVLVVLFGWESVYYRNHIYEIDTASQDNVGIIKAQPVTEVKDLDRFGAETTHLENKAEGSENMSQDQPLQRDTFLTRMKPYRPASRSQESLLKLFIRPFGSLLNPVILWAIVLNAFIQVFVIGISYILAMVFGAPPYNLDTAHIGYIYVGPLVFGLLGCLMCGLISDPMVKWLSRRNNGIYEPEFRLVLMIFVPITTTIGYFLFGNLIAEGRSPVAGGALFGVCFMAVQFGANASGAYLVDAFRDLSVEAFVAMMALKNFLFFGFSYFINNWVAGWGPARAFNCIGGITLGVSLLTIPVYIFGKRIRAWWFSSPFLSKL